jgi:hypothetical protein
VQSSSLSSSLTSSLSIDNLQTQHHYSPGSVSVLLSTYMLQRRNPRLPNQDIVAILTWYHHHHHCQYYNYHHSSYYRMSRAFTSFQDTSLIYALDFFLACLQSDYGIVGNDHCNDTSSSSSSSSSGSSSIRMNNDIKATCTSLIQNCWGIIIILS